MRTKDGDLIKIQQVVPASFLSIGTLYVLRNYSFSEAIQVSSLFFAVGSITLILASGFDRASNYVKKKSVITSKYLLYSGALSIIYFTSETIGRNQGPYSNLINNLISTIFEISFMWSSFFGGILLFQMIDGIEKLVEE